MSPATLRDFATVGDALKDTTSKLEKAAILARSFTKLDDPADLRHALTFHSGRTFPPTDSRVTGVSSAAIRNAILEVTHADPNHLRELAIRSGELGEALGLLWEELGGWNPPSSASGMSHPTSDIGLTLSDLAAAFSDLALHGAATKKRSILVKLLRRITSAREAVYLLKILFGDLRTGVQDGILLDAIAGAFSPEGGVKDLRQALLLEGDLAEVAVLAKEHRLADARFALFRPLSFMLAAVVADEAEAIKQIADRPFIAEDKLDGIRAQIHKDGRNVAIYTRTLDNVTESFPDIVAQIRELKDEPGNHSLLLDGEIVPWRNGKALPFAHIQKRLGRKKVPAKIIAENPAHFIAFDLLYADGAPLLAEPLQRRKDRLGATGISTLGFTPITTPDQIKSLFDTARTQNNEGLLLKDLNSPYLPGRRGQVWYKLKTHLPTLDCVVTAAEHGHGKRRNHLSDYTFAVWSAPPADGGELLNIGKAYSGVTDAEIEELTKLFQSVSIGFDGRVHQVQPKLVLEIAFDAIQRSDRHASGYALRFPRIKTIRWDKPIAEADTLQSVEQIHNSPQNLNRVDESQVSAPDSPQAPAQEPSLFD